jgi:hypothetical protein
MLRWIAIIAVVGVVTTGLSGPPVFDHRARAFGAASARAAAGETLASGGLYRTQFWMRSWAVFEDRPLVGSGAHTLVGASETLVPATWAHSNLAHNGYLQALSDGGLALGLPFLLACVLGGLAAVRQAYLGLRASEERWIRFAVPVTLLALMAHSAVDFDWSHPSNLFLCGLLLGCTLALPTSRNRAVESSRFLLVCALALASTSVVAVARWDGTSLDVGAVRATPAMAAITLRSQGSQLFRDFRWGREVLRRSVGGGGPVALNGVAAGDVRWALDATRRMAAVDPALQSLRLRGQMALGDSSGALMGLDGLRVTLGPTRFAPVADGLAWILEAAGDHSAARRLVLRYLQVADASELHAGSHLDVLLKLDAEHADEVDRCAFAAVPSSVRLTGTKDPGAPTDPADCQRVLTGALG